MSVLLAQTMNIGNLNLYELIFETILQLQRCPGMEGWGCLTGEIAHDFIYALFLPHIVILIWLFIATRSPAIFREHKGIGNLLGLGAYILIIYEGWYGSILAKFLIFWLVLTVITSLGYFFLSAVVWGPQKRYKLGKAIGDRLTSPIKRDKLLSRIDDDLADLRNDYKKADKKGKTDEATEIRKKIIDLEEYRKKIERGV